MIEKLANIIALGGAVTGSALVAANIGAAGIGYIMFLASSIASVYLLMRSSDAPTSLIYQNVFFVVINLIGIVHHFS